jgi:predicted enzyme related to lactoylglutathione lyase
MTTRHHKLDYIEIPATDIAASKTFYGEAFGWTFQDWGDDYVDIQDAGISGGLRKVAHPPPRGGTLAILYSDDLEASEKAITGAGGRIIDRHEFPGGRRFHFVDPSGVELAVWTKAEH